MDKALETQLANIQKRAGKTLDQLSALVKNSGLQKHGEMVAMLKTTLGMGHGDANTLVHYTKGHPSFSDSHAVALRAMAGKPAAADDALLDATYTGPKAALRPNTRVEVGLNMKDVAGTARLEALPPGGMCQYRVKLSSASEVDAELLRWIRQAYDAAG